MRAVEKCKKILTTTQNHYEILDGPSKIPSFYDEPNLYLYSIRLCIDVKKNLLERNSISGSAASFKDPSLTLLKCLAESLERKCLTEYSKKNIQYISIDKWDKNIFDLDVFLPDSSNGGNIGCIPGYNFSSDTPVLLPAELIYLYYYREKKDIIFHFPHVSTGAAGGFEKTQALLSGIYEVVERDAFMNAYLNSINLPRVDLKFVNDKTISTIFNLCKRYNLELFVLDATNDLGIPTFISILVDRTGYGPSIAVGAKSGMNIKEAIIGSINESFMIRSVVRRYMRTRKDGSEIDKFQKNIIERGFFWAPTQMIKKLSFFLDTPLRRIDYKNFEGTKQEELKHVSSQLINKRYKIYFVDISDKACNKINFTVCKVIIPGLQPLYLFEEEKKYINKLRLREVSRYYGIKSKINEIPHPFL